MFYGEIWEISGTTISKNTCKRVLLYKIFNNLDEAATYPDEEDRELLDESDNEFSCSDDDSDTECY